MESTGITYPTLENLGGRTYEIKFTGGTLYELQKNGIEFNPRIEAGASPADMKWRGNFSNIVDVLKTCIEFPGTAKELADLCFNRRDEIFTKLMEAWGNLMLPSIQLKLRETAAKQAEVLPKQMPDYVAN